MSNEAINSFKKVLHEGMIENFKKDGFLTPIMFFYKGGLPFISTIDDTFLNSNEGKMNWL